MLDYVMLKVYQENLAIFIEEHNASPMLRIWKKVYRILSEGIFKPAVKRVVFSERLLEYPLLYHYLDLEPGSKILDFGCVESLLSLQMCSLGYRVTGMDFRPYPFKHENFNFIQGDILEWEPPSDCFDAVVSISVVEHVGLSGYGDPKKSQGDRIAIQKLVHSLKPGGKLYLTVPVGKATVQAGSFRVYDTRGLRELVPGIETVRLFYKSGRCDVWREGTANDIDSLVYEDYHAMAPVQGVAFIVAEKGLAA